MNKIVLATAGAALVLAIANPVLACGGGRSYRAPHHQAKAVVVPAIVKTDKTEVVPGLAETTEPIGGQSALPSLEQGSRS